MAGETLNITGGNAAGQTITLEQELVIGRSTPGLGSLGGDSEISRVHARVFHDPSGRLIVEDLGSTNGTFVNGNRIAGQQALNPGDQVRVGQTTMSVEGGAAGATTVGNVVPAPVPAAPPAAAGPPPPTQQLPPQNQPQQFGAGPGGAPQGVFGGPPQPGFGGGPVGGPPQRSGGGPNRNLLIALAAALLIALVVAGLAIGGVFGGSSKKKNTAQTTPTTATSSSSTPTQTTPPPVAMPKPPSTNNQGGGGSSGGGKFPALFKNAFVRGCARRLSSSQCRCIINRAEKGYSLPSFLRAARASRQGQAPPKLRGIIVKCLAS
jgi:hypothetical protein